MILAGDIICVRGQGWLADGIVRAEYGSRPPATAVSHVGVITAADNLVIEVTEALTKVETHALAVTLSQCKSAWIVQHKGLTGAQRLAVVNAALEFSGDDYGYFDLLLQGADAVTRTSWFTDKLAFWLGRWPICSYVAGEAYRRIGVTFDTGVRSVKPSDIMSVGMADSVDYDVWQIYPPQVVAAVSR